MLSWLIHDDSDTEVMQMPNDNNDKTVGFLRHAMRLLLWFFGVLALGCLLFTYVLMSVHVPTGSMEPTIPTDSRFIASRVAYLKSGPQHGDIVVFLHEETGEGYVKRVIGLPGDTIVIKDGEVWRNGKKLSESYAVGSTYVNDDARAVTYTVPEGEYFMLGDNRDNSGDSRVWANPYVPRSDILAKYLFALPDL